MIRIAAHKRHPWRTIQHAADTVLAGSAVNVRGEIYEEHVNIKTSLATRMTDTLPLRNLGADDRK